MHDSAAVPTRDFGLPDSRLRGVAVPLAGTVLLGAMFLAVAWWNGFPLVFYDTGAYLLEGLGGVFLVERSPVYSLLLFAAGGYFSLWLVVILQAAMTAFIIIEVARAEVPGLTLLGLFGIGAVLTVATGIDWYVGQVEPDAMTPLVVLGSYLLLFRGTGMGHGRRVLVVVITGLAVACHPSHLGLSGGLLIVGGIIRYAARFWPFLPQLRLRSALASLGLALALLLASNFALARSLFISRSGSVFVFARLMQDGIVQRLLDDTCPQSGYKLCAYKNRLKSRADAWLWAPDSSFRALGGFHSPQQQDEDNRIIFDSLKRYPVLQLRAAVYDSALQFLTFKTGDGIEPQVWVLGPGLHRLIPWQMRAYLEARQQKGLLRFRTLNLVHVPVGMLALLGLLLVLYKTGFSRRWDEAALPALVLLALMGNAIICGTFSNPHDRYQSRVIWLPVLVLLLARARDPHALQPSPESVT